MKHPQYKALPLSKAKTAYLTEYRDKAKAAHFLLTTNKNYDKMRTDLTRNYALGNDMYPKTLTAAIEALAYYRTDRATSRRDKTDNTPIKEEDKVEPTEASF